MPQPSHDYSGAAQQFSEPIDGSAPTYAVAPDSAVPRKPLVTDVELGAIARRRDRDNHLGLKASMFIGRLDVPRKHNPGRRLDGAVAPVHGHDLAARHVIGEALGAADVKVEIEHNELGFRGRRQPTADQARIGEG